MRQGFLALLFQGHQGAAVTEGVVTVQSIPTDDGSRRPEHSAFSPLPATPRPATAQPP
jgi:hypothetical protein